MMFGSDGIKDMANGIFKDMMKEAKQNANADKLGKVNFVIEKILDDGKVIRANSFNPILLVDCFNEFERQVKKKPKERKQ